MIKENRNGFVLLIVSAALLLLTVMIHAISSQLIAAKKMLTHKYNYEKIILMAQSGINLAPHFFSDITFIQDSHNKEQLYENYNLGLVKQISNTKFSLIKSDTHLIQVINFHIDVFAGRLCDSSNGIIIEKTTLFRRNK